MGMASPFLIDKVCKLGIKRPNVICQLTVNGRQSIYKAFHQSAL